MEGIVPLFYNMRKAPSHHISNVDMYDGMCAAWTGGNIGMISNDITKIWNSGEINQEALDSIKRLCCTNNFVIDYAKTLYKPEVPEEINSIISSYTKSKVPHFFKFAKDYKADNVEPINKSTVNKISKFFKVKRLSYKNLPLFFYRKLMNNPEIEIDYDLINCFNKLNREYHFKVNNLDRNKGNIPYISHKIKGELSEFGYSDVDITDMLIKYQYSEKNTDKKAALWFCYGDIIVDNLKNNLDPLSKVCMECGTRFYPNSNRQKVCEHCRNKKQDEYITKICVDCGKTFTIPKSNRRTTRCTDCQEKRQRELTRERVAKFRNNV